MSTKKIPKSKSPKRGRKVPPYPFEFRLRVARLHVEDGYPALLLAQEFDISESSVYSSTSSSMLFAGLSGSAVADASHANRSLSRR